MRFRLWFPVLVAGATALYCKGQPPPVVELLKSIQQSDEKSKPAAIRRVIELGEKAKPHLPQIITALEQSGSFRHQEQVIRLVTAIDRTQTKVHLRNYLRSVSRSGRVTFSEEFAKETAPDIVSELAELVSDSNPVVAKNCVSLLTTCGPKAKQAVPQLIDCLTTFEIADRWEVVRAILQLDATKVRQVMPCLSYLLDRGYVDGSSASPLLAPSAEISVTMLISVIEEFDGPAPIQIASALAGLGRPALQPLSDVLINGKLRTRVTAIMALGNMGSERDAANAEIQSALGDRDVEVRLAAVDALISQDYDHTRRAAMLPTLLVILKGDNSAYARAALQLVRRIGEPAKPLCPELVVKLKNEDLGIAWDAAEALWAIDRGHGATLMDVLRRVLRSGTVAQQRQAVSICGSMGRLALPLMPDLNKLCHSGDLSLRLNCCDVIQIVNPDSLDDVVRSLTFILEQRNRLFRRYQRQALARLEKIGPAARFCLPTLARFVEDEESSQRCTAARAMVRIAPQEETVGSEFLRRGIWNRNANDWDEAAESLQALGPKASFAIPELLAILRERPTNPDAVVIEILRAIGPDARPAAAYLIEALTLPNYQNKESCKAAIRDIAPEIAEQLKLK
jgi:HEAT repeat protein